MYPEQALFGSGELWGVGSDALLTPIPFGVLQDVSLDHSFTIKELRGQNLFAEKINRSQAKITGKAKFGKVNGLLVNQLFFNGALSAGREKIVSGEAGTVPGSVAYTIVVANAASFVDDLGVTDANTGQRFEKVAAGGEAAGKYSVAPATGTYTFAAADANRDVTISYSYTDAGGHTIAVTNEVAGIAPRFEIRLREVDDDGEFGVKLYSCTSSKLTIATKMGDFVIPEFDFEAQANAAGKVMDLYFE